jgi:sensor histidine kinase YesM
MPAPPNPSNPRPRSALRSFLRVLLMQPLWAIPFAIFFGTLFGATRETYWLSYKMSLVFAYSIGIAIWVVARFIAPRCSDDDQNWQRAAWYVGMALLGSYVASFIIQVTIQPGFFGSWRAVATGTMFSLVFVALFSSASFARSYYRKAVDRARAVEQARAELVQAELTALRAQIQPHFLFNTLNSIASLISVNPRAAEETTTQLADVFRYTLRASGLERVPLGDELEFLRNVLAIERTRFGERLHVVEELEPGLESILVPSLLLQPIVENAVRHGIGARVAGGTLKIAAQRATSAAGAPLLVVTIEDDGPGFDPAAPRGPGGSGAGFGLHSVRERLRVAGPPHAFAIETPPAGGTRVVITLPASPPGAAAPASQGDLP